MKPVAIIGMGLSPQDLTVRHQQIIESADVLVGGQRLLDHFKETPARKKVIDKKISEAVDFIKARMATQSVVVLASGDPLFFGIGAILVKALGPQNVAVYPNISSIAAAFARIKEPWSQVRVVSLHGRQDDRSLFKALEEAHTVALFTDPIRNPAWIARRLISEDYVATQMCVLESLGTAAERFSWCSLEQASEMTFAEPNLVVVKRNDPEQALEITPRLGMPDNYFIHEKGLITKSEIRAITLAKLQLSTDHVLWDLGAGSGSVSIEASLLAPRGKIVAVEKNPRRIEQIKRNLARFGTKNIEVLQAELPDGLDALPPPDRIFIGGGGRKLSNIIDAAAGFLKSNGIIIINTVLMPNVLTAMETLEALGFKTSMVQAQISHSRRMPWSARLEAQNPVWIIGGMRKSECGKGLRNNE